jgi:glycosyltransferase involved in cell wall biosynthesis
MVSTHKYGLHGRVNEHFGIAVAETLAGGALPFVHKSGGPREIVGEDDRVLYQDIGEAVSKVDEVLTESDGDEILEDLPDAEEKFGLKRFRRDIRGAVEDVI